MSGIDDREKAFEAKYGKDQEMKFKAEMRRNRKIGAWAAQQLGIEADAVEAYIDAVVDADFEKPGDQDVLEKLVADFKEHGIDISEHRIQLELDRCLMEAKAELVA
ncbi:MAG: DUF1476 domain-containing protein [Alphaproteobacteria bacterium]